MSSSEHPDLCKVRKHETLWFIAETLDGRPRPWTEIACLNGLSDPPSTACGHRAGRAGRGPASIPSAQRLGEQEWK
ncbi:MAG: hypothetical protein RLZZ117_213 [Cyanobacteriota bacterium]